MTIAASLVPHVETARRVAFVIAEAERNLGLSETKLPLNDRMQAVLVEALHRADEISSDAYEMIYALTQVACGEAGDPDLQTKVEAARDDLNLL